mmetsp:Transcript_67514/g.119835  ORF Transcript_67514/g.119835 Transcript_67514/m.119835 type:complete len:465 (+) Transcript_67514:92-1486(+)
MAMLKIALLSVLLACVGQGRRLHGTPELRLEQRGANSLRELAKLFHCLHPVASFNHPSFRKGFQVRKPTHAGLARLPVAHMVLAHHTNLNLKGTEELKREVLDARLRTLGPDHPETLSAKRNLAKTLQRLGDLKEAEALQQQVVEAQMRTLGPEDPHTISAKRDLAETLKASGDLKGVERLHREVFEARRHTLGPDHDETIKSKNELAVALQSLGDLKGAAELQREVLEVMEECMPEGEPLPPFVRSFNKALLDVIKTGIDTIYQGRNIPRFYVLETLARVPYFAFLTCLHMYESCGMRERTRLMRTHYAEADNELHHLLIMESLGGSDQFIDRFIAQHMAFGYFFYSIAVYMFIPKAAYHLSELIEAHAFNTYTKYLEDNRELLQAHPVPDIAREYYGGEDALRNYLNKGEQPPPLNNLYDVFMLIRNDEQDHWRTLVNLVQHDELDGVEGCPIVGTDMLAFA